MIVEIFNGWDDTAQMMRSYIWNSVALIRVIQADRFNIDDCVMVSCALKLCARNLGTNNRKARMMRKMIRPLLIVLVLLVVVLVMYGAQVVGTTQTPSLLAFVSTSFDPNTRAIIGDVIVMDMERGTSTNITSELEGSVGEPTWSRNGELAFSLIDDDDVEMYIWNGVTLINASQNPLARDVTPVWSDDGRLAFVSQGDERVTIYVWDHGVLSDLNLNGVGNMTPAWSSDGRLAYTVPSVSNTDPLAYQPVDVYVWDGTTATMIDSVTGLDSLAWSHDGRLAYPADIGEHRDIFIWDGATSQNISGDPVDNYTPIWSPDGRMAFTNFGSGSHLYVWDAGTMTRLSQDNSEDVEGAWSSDGRLAFASNRTGDYEVFVWDGATFTNISQNSTDENNPRSGSDYDTNPVWSPNGWLAFESYRDGSRREIYVWDGTTLRNVSQSSSDDRSPVWWLPAS